MLKLFSVNRFLVTNSFLFSFLFLFFLPFFFLFWKCRAIYIFYFFWFHFFMFHPRVNGRQNNGFPQMLTSKFQCLWACYVTEQRAVKLQMKLGLLTNWPWDSKVSLNYLDAPSTFTRVLISGRGRQSRKNQRDSIMKRTWSDIAGFEDGTVGLWVKECR